MMHLFLIVFFGKSTDNTALTQILSHKTVSFARLVKLNEKYNEVPIPYMDQDQLNIMRLKN